MSRAVFAVFTRFTPVRWRPRQPALLAGIAILLCWGLTALLAPWVAPFDPIAQDPSVSLQPPGGAHPFGTDNYGRDILSRVIWASRIDLQISLLGVVFPFCIGTLLGALSGYLGGLTDTLVMRVIDVVLAFPFLVLMLAIIAVLGPGLLSFYIAMTMVGWVSYARLVRAQVLAAREREFVEAAKALGASDLRIFMRHILPNIMQPLIVQSAIGMAGAVLAEATLSFLGLGVPPPTPSWGAMLNDARAHLFDAPHTVVFPAIAVMCCVLSFNFLGDALRDYLDPRTRLSVGL